MTSLHPVIREFLDNIGIHRLGIGNIQVALGHRAVELLGQALDGRIVSQRDFRLRRLLLRRRGRRNVDLDLLWRRWNRRGGLRRGRWRRRRYRRLLYRRRRKRVVDPRRGRGGWPRARTSRNERKILRQRG